MESKKRFKVEIGNQTYTIVGNSTPEHMRAVIELVSDQLQTIKEMMPDISDERAAILLAINAVSDQLKKQTELEKCQETLAKYEDKQE